MLNVQIAGLESLRDICRTVENSASHGAAAHATLFFRRTDHPTRAPDKINITFLGWDKAGCSM